jgi:hypothetical protein
MCQGAAVNGDLAVLTEPDASGLLDSAVATMGGVLRDWSATHVDHRPGRSTTVAYRTRVQWPDGERTETLGARLSSAAPPSTDHPGVVRMSDGSREVQVWRFPADPALPGLRAVCDPGAVAELLRATGVEPSGAGIRVVGYRPCRRAVVEITTPTARVFAKVLRPGAAADVHRRLEVTRAAGLPTPRSLGWNEDGILVLEPLPGLGLREVVRRYGSHACSPDELLDLLDRLPGELTELPRRRPWSESAAYYADVIAAAVPELGDHAGAVAAAVAAELDADDDADDDAVHGDFYEAQLLASDGRITGLLDVDTAGPGRRVDDLACMVAHLSVLVTMAPATSTGVRSALASWTGRFDRAVDPHQLRIRAAGAVLSLAIGPYRTQESGWPRAVADRIELAGQWLHAARTTGLPTLRGLSSEPPDCFMGDGNHGL